MQITISQQPDNAMLLVEAESRKCYGGAPEETPNTEFLIRLFKSGHYSVFQHVYYTFDIEGVSRHLVWDLLHRHPFYSTSQVSQRYTYTSLDETSAVIPNIGKEAETKKLYKSIGNTYEKLVDLLVEDGHSKKEAQEDARYILPIGTHTKLGYTLNLISIIRLLRTPKIRELTTEELQFLNELYLVLTDTDPFLKEVIDFALSLESPYSSSSYKPTPVIVHNKKSEFLINIKNHECLIQELKDRANGSISLDSGSKEYKYLDDIQLKYSYLTSFAADCQTQRHRSIKQIRPDSLLEYFTDICFGFGCSYQAGRYIPESIRKNKEAVELFETTIKYVEKFIDDYVSSCYHEKIKPSRDVELLFLNCFRHSVVEYGNIGDFQEKWTHRLCNLAQEEIREQSKWQVQELVDKQYLSKIWRYLGPPCFQRKEIHQMKCNPCSEGSRSCFLANQLEGEMPWEYSEEEGLPNWIKS